MEASKLEKERKIEQLFLNDHPKMVHRSTQQRITNSFHRRVVIKSVTIINKIIPQELLFRFRITT